MKTKIRSQQIVIDLPTEDGEVLVRSTLQKCIKDDDNKTVQVVDRVGYVHRPLSEIILQMVTFTDPVTQQTHTISGAGASILIRDMVMAWIVQDRGGVINEFGDIIEGAST
jgi:hypothetical protein